MKDVSQKMRGFMDRAQKAAVKLHPKSLGGFFFLFREPIGRKERIMKKTLKVLWLLIAIAVLMLALASCAPTSDGEGSVTFVIAGAPERVYTVDLSKVEITEGAYSVLKYLRDTEDVEFTATESATGAFLNTVGGITLGEGQYIWVWTSVESDFDASGFVADKEYGGKILKSSKSGISEMSVVDGAVIYIGAINF